MIRVRPLSPEQPPPPSQTDEPEKMLMPFFGGILLGLTCAGLVILALPNSGPVVTELGKGGKGKEEKPADSKNYQSTIAFHAGIFFGGIIGVCVGLILFILASAPR